MPERSGVKVLEGNALEGRIPREELVVVGLNPRRGNRRFRRE